MTSRLIAVACGLTAAVGAQSTSMTSVYLYGAQRTDGEASVIAVAPGAATTYSVTCAPFSVTSDCFLGPGVTVVDGPSTAAIHLTASDYFVDLTCSISADTATCVETSGGPSAYEPGVTTTVVGSFDQSKTPVMITAGLEMVQLPTSTSTSGASRRGWSTAGIAGTAGACGLAGLAVVW